MAFEATKTELTEGLALDVRKDWPQRFWRPKRVPVGPVPAEQKYAVIALGLAASVTVGDHDALISALEAISGIQKAVITTYGQAPESAKIPSGYDLVLTVESAYIFEVQDPVLPSMSPQPSLSPSPSPSMSPSMSISPSSP